MGAAKTLCGLVISDDWKLLANINAVYRTTKVPKSCGVIARASSTMVTKLLNDTSAWSPRLPNPACSRRLLPSLLRTRRTAARSDLIVGRGRSGDSTKVASVAVTLSKALELPDAFHTTRWFL